MKHLQRSLKNRQLQMIAIGGAVGTDLFYSSAHVMRPSLVIAPAWVLLLWLIYVLRRKDSRKSEQTVSEECSFTE